MEVIKTPLLHLQQALSLQILVGLLVDHVAAGVLVLLLKHACCHMRAWPWSIVSASAHPIHHTDSPLCLAAIAPMPSETSALPTLEKQTHDSSELLLWRATFTRYTVLTRHGVLDLRDVGKVSGVGDPEAAHAVSVPPLLQKVQHTHVSARIAHTHTLVAVFCWLCCINGAKSVRGAAGGRAFLN